MSLVIKDAFWQIFGRILSAIAGFLVIKLITPYLGPLRYGDYSTILKYFAIWSAFADFGLYVLALKHLGKFKKETQKLQIYYNKYVGARFFLIFIIYLTALIIAYLIPSYTSNPFIIWGLPIGMLFSATFMATGIIQIPLQLFWQMKHVTFALILARLIQIIILILTIYILFKNVDFNVADKNSILAFNFILLSVLLSGLTQFIYTWYIGKNYLKLNPIFDFKFIKNIITSNWKYGLAYYLSSFHILVVLILLSIFYPTSKGFEFVGIWALALALLEIFLIIPSALSNALIHKISHEEKNIKLKKYGNMILLNIFIGFMLFFNFLVFNKEIIYIIGGKQYLSDNINIGSDFILPFLGVVLILSFIKQIFNYIFVTFDLQNKLLKINLIGVILGLIIGIPLILKYNLIGGIITQLTLEILFVSISIIIAKKYNIIPSINLKQFIFIIISFTLISFLAKYVSIYFLNYNETVKFIIYAILFNISIIILFFKLIKNIAKNL